jgi:hypothetical protein
MAFCKVTRKPNMHVTYTKSLTRKKKFCTVFGDKEELLFSCPANSFFRSSHEKKPHCLYKSIDC